jgi:hypothetical protein
MSADAMRRMSKFSAKIAWQTPYLCASSWTVWQQFSWMSSRIFSTSVGLLVLGYPELSSSSTDTRAALKCECYSQTTIQLKNVPKSPKRHFKCSSRGYTKLYEKLDADMLLDFAIHCRQNKTRSRKSTRVKTNACSQRVVTWQTDAAGLQ